MRRAVVLQPVTIPIQTGHGSAQVLLLIVRAQLVIRHFRKSPPTEILEVLGPSPGRGAAIATVTAVPVGDHQIQVPVQLTIRPQDAARDAAHREYRGYAGQIASGFVRRGDRVKIMAQAKELMEARKQHQPWGLPSAGSVFKNPQDESAGKLIESAGLKGKTVGGAQVSDKHANFIVNTGNARAADVLSLMEIVKNAVLEHRGVRLEPEIKIIGED